MNPNNLDYDADDMPEGGFLKRNWLALCVGTLVLGGGTSAAIALSQKGGTGSRKTQDIVMVQLPPPPVVTPPPPPPPQTPEVEEEIKSEDEVKEETPPDNTPGTNAAASNAAPDAFGLKSKGGRGGSVILRPKSLASTWAPYANQAASRIADAMRRHQRLKNATMSITAKVWIDSTGRITRATTQSTGDAALDAALRNEVLNGMVLSGPPPEGMKMPVNLKLSARRPG